MAVLYQLAWYWYARRSLCPVERVLATLQAFIAVLLRPNARAVLVARSLIEDRFEPEDQTDRMLILDRKAADKQI